MQHRRSLATLLAPLALAGAAAGQWNETLVFTPPGQVGVGHSVAVFGDRAFVGAPGAPGAVSVVSGAVYVFERTGPGAAWTQGTTIFPDDGVAFDLFGYDVAVSGDRLVASAPQAHSGGVSDSGAVYVFERDPASGVWSEVVRLEPDVPVANGVFGLAVDVSGDTLVTIDTSGAWVFERDHGGPGAWGLNVKHTLPPWVRDCAIDGSTIAVGSDDNLFYVFERDLGGPGAWQEALQVTAPSGAGGNFGWFVEIEGDTLLASATLNGPASSLRVHERDAGGPGAWGETAVINDPSGASFNWFGGSFGLSGDTLVAGTPLDNVSGVGPDAGSVSVFQRDLGGPGAWGHVQTFFASDADPVDYFGGVLAIEDDVLFVCSADNGPQPGKAYAFEGPTQVDTYCTAGTSANGCAALLDSAGVANSAGSGFQVLARGVEGAKQGLFYFGTNGSKASSWGGGASFQCVKGPHVRTPVQTSGGTAGQCDGGFLLDFNAWMATHPAKAPGAGQTVWMQAWYRDPGSTPTTSLSDGLSFEVLP